VKKKYYLLVLVVAAILGFVFVIKTQGPISKAVPAKEREVKAGKISKEEEERQIKANTEKYQPKETSNTAKDTLDISAKSAIVVDENTGAILFEKNPHQKLAPASITKILTLSVALENLKKDQMITVSQEAADQEPNKIVMKAGEKLQLEDLLYGLMMISANDAARAIAESVPGGFDSFIKLMNNKVRLLGLKDTNFKNPSGLDDNEHYSTVFDIATMTRYALLEHGTEVVAYAGEKKDHSVYPTDHNESHWWSHISAMLYRYPGMIAAKTGYTDIAKSTFIGVAERNGRRLNVVLMGSTDANNDVPRLLDYGFAH
jgi:D-alanyl-D-alanine carboxypeptidase